MKTRYWVTLFAAVALVCAALSVWLLTRAAPGSVAGVYSGGVLVCEIDVKDRGSWREYEFIYGDGVNLVVVDGDGIRVREASCADGSCVRHGRLGGGAPIVCLPNRLVIRWLDGAAPPYDAVAGG